MNFPVPLKARYFLGQGATVSFYGKTAGVRFDTACRNEYTITVFVRARIALSR